MASGKVDEAAVYQCTGNPLPQDVEQIVNWLLNESFVDCYNSESCIAFPMSYHFPLQTSLTCILAIGCIVWKNLTCMAILHYLSIMTLSQHCRGFGFTRGKKPIAKKKQNTITIEHHQARFFSGSFIRIASYLQPLDYITEQQRSQLWAHRNGLIGVSLQTLLTCKCPRGWHCLTLYNRYTRKFRTSWTGTCFQPTFLSF